MPKAKRKGVAEGSPFKGGPIRRGAIFCSPWCGGGCTWEEHWKAGESAARLAERLGPAWEPDVWENLGWHYAARHAGGHLRVIEVRSGAAWKQVTGEVRWIYHAYLGPDGVGGRFLGEGATPQEAVERVIEQARAEVARIKGWLRKSQ